MKLIIGIDEAGYGPNLGPLVIGASVWLSPSDRLVDGCLELLAPEFRAEPWRSNSDFIPLGDSKKIYKPGLGLDGLMAGVEFLKALCDTPPTSASAWLHRLAPDDVCRVEKQPWYSPEFDDASSAAACPGAEIERRARHKLESMGIRCLGLRARVIDEEEFNHAVELAGNKSTALSEWSIGLVADCFHQYLNANNPAFGSIQKIEVYCDRHGGRKRYAPVLSHILGRSSGSSENQPDNHSVWLDVLEENSQCSRYQGVWGGREMTIQFRVQGDSLFPSAASSLVAKLMRELLMVRLNRFWREAVGKELRFTAGYAVDAARFAEDIRVAQGKLGIPKSRWWRER
ncbi:MAG: hypothetical protein ACK5O8_20050 [Pirellula sp.]|jgi:hypothetical protein